MRVKTSVPSKREKIVATAVELFAKQGFHATGIDTIVEGSGVAKRTLYAYFRSKDELILAVLRHYDGLFRNGFMRQVEAGSHSARGRLLTIFDVAEEWFGRSNFYGCIFIKAAGEYSEQDTPIRQSCKESKGLMRGYVRTLCEKAGAPEPDKLAEEIAILLEGAIVTAQVSQKPGAARIAKRAAKALIDGAIPRAAIPR